MKKMSFKSIFNWLYGATLDRAMSVQQPTNIQPISNLSLTMSTVKVAQKSRIRPLRYAFAIVAMLTFGFGNAWGATVTFNATNSSFSGSAPYTITQDSVTFSLNVPNWYNDGNNGHFYIYTSNTTATIGWTPATGFTIAVTGVSLNGQNTSEKHWQGWSKKTFTGSSYIRSHTSSDNTEVNISQSTTTTTYPYTTSNTNLFPSGNALGNSAYFKLRAEKGHNDADNDNSYEYQINWATITYTVTPPAPTLKNGSSVTRSQFVEGRSNNTITLTDYFEPFKSGVSMSYVVKKKNGSGEYVTIDTGYDITSNVFKTEDVGEYQIFATSNATGAFNASESSSALAVTIEEVRPVTISVGSQELYVGGTTSMTITERLNTTKDVVFEYDEDFFDYNESTHVLTAKNDANASFSTIEKSIRVTQEAAGIYAAVDMTINFTIKKNVPTFTWNTREHYYYNETISHFFKSSNTATNITVTSTDAHKNIATIVDSALVVYNVAGTARVTMTQAENYYWAEHTEWRDVTPEWKNNQLTLTVTEDNYTSVIENRYAGSSDRFRWLNGGVLLGSKDISLSDGAEGWDSRYIDIHFTGMPDSLSFTYERSVSTSTGMDWWVKEKTEDGEWGDETIYHPNGNPASGTCKVPLKPNTRWVRLRGYCNYGVYFRNIKITKREQFETDSTSFDFKTQIKNANVPSKSFKFKHANAGYTVTAASNDSHYKVSLNNSDFYSSIIIPNTGGDRMDSSVVYVKYYPNIAGDVEETHNATITFSDALSNSATVSLTGKTQAKLATHLEYIGSDSYSVNADNIAATTLFEVRDANGNVVPGAVITLSKNETSAIDIVSDDKVVDFTCGGSATITAHYAGDNTTYQAASDLEQAITITRLADVISFNDAKASMVVDEALDITGWVSALSESSITVSSLTSSYLVLEGNTLRAVGKGQGKLQAVSAGNCTYNSGTKTLDILVRNPNDPCKHPLLYNSGTLSVGNNGGDNNKILPIDDGPQDTLTFKVWKYSGLTTGNSPKVTFLDANGDEIASEEFSGLSTSEPTNPNVIIDLKNKKYNGTKKLKFSAPSTFNQYFGEIKVSQQTYLTASTTSVTMSTVKACVQATGQFNISYSDLSRLQLSQTNENFTYEVWQGDTKLNGFSNDCGDYGTYTVKFFYTPQAKGAYSNTVTISASGKEQVITLSGTANAPEREIVWDIPTGNTISATQSVDLTAYAQTDCESPAGSVYYTYSPAVDGAATIDGARITFNKAATITVTAHTVTSDMYEDATTVDKVWTVGKVGTQMKTLPTITSTITYGDNSSVVTHNNTFTAVSVLDNTHEVAGSIAYVSPTNFTAAGEMNLIFTFTPTIEWDVYEPIQFTVPVTVQKAETTLSWTAYPTSVVYGNTATYAASSVSDGTITYSIKEGNEYASIDANTGVLTVIEAEHTVIVQASQAAGTNYVTPQAITTEVVLNKADATLEWVTAQASVEYGATGVAYAASSVSNGAITYNIIAGSDCASIDSESGELTITKAGSFTVQASQAAGTNHNAPEAITKDVMVNKITPTLTWTAAPTELAYNASGTAYSASSVSDGAISYSIVSGDTYAEIDAQTGELAILVPGQTVTVQAAQAEGTNYLAPEAITINVAIGAAPLLNIFTNATGDGDWDNPDNWDGGSVPGNNLDVIISGNMTIDDSRTVGNLTIVDGASVQVVVSGNLTVTGVSENRDGYGDLVIANGGEVNVTGTLKVRDLVIASKSCTDGTSISGQLTGENNITNVDGDVYIDITLVEGALDDSQWYGFTVPFEVDAEQGVYRYENGNVVGPLAWGNQYDIANYDSNKRYNTGKGWQYYRGTLNPGEFYYITLDGTYNVYRFKKKASSAISSGNTKSLNLYGANSESKDANWNPVGNPTLTYTITDYNGYVQIYQNGQSAYKAVPASEATFVVGCPFFIQAAVAGTLTLNEGTTTQLYAPARGEEKAFNISMQAETGGYADNIYLNTSDEADGTYRVGHDLLKAGTSKLVPQLWIAQGEDKLCVNEAELNNNNAYATLGLYAPTTGNYVLDIVDAPQDATLYLTYDGTVIWNLSESAYTLSLMKGTTANYGLQLVREARNTATGVEQVGSETQMQKFVHNGVLYINKDGVLYDAMGKKVK